MTSAHDRAYIDSRYDRILNNIQNPSFDSVSLHESVAYCVCDDGSRNGGQYSRLPAIKPLGIVPSKALKTKPGWFPREPVGQRVHAMELDLGPPAVAVSLGNLRRRRENSIPMILSNPASCGRDAAGFSGSTPDVDEFRSELPVLLAAFSKIFNFRCFDFLDSRSVQLRLRDLVSSSSALIAVRFEAKALNKKSVLAIPCPLRRVLKSLCI